MEGLPFRFDTALRLHYGAFDFHWGWLLSVLATAASYFALTFYDRTALAYAGAQLPQRVVAKTAFIAYALSNTIGLGVLTGIGERQFNAFSPTVLGGVRGLYHHTYTNPLGSVSALAAGNGA